MKLEVDRAAESLASEGYSQAVASQFGQLMEVLGIRQLRVKVARGAAGPVAFADSVAAFDFAPPGVASLAVAAAPDLARAMHAAGIVRLEISSVPDGERRTLEESWRGAVSGPDSGTELVPPPDGAPDMAPVEVDL